MSAEIERRRTGGSVEGMLRLLTEVLAERGSEPFPDDEGTLRLRNCPFDRLADAHRQPVCGMNLAILGRAGSSAEVSSDLMSRPDLPDCHVQGGELQAVGGVTSTGASKPE